jgi:opacity protein-like surface antigen
MRKMGSVSLVLATALGSFALASAAQAQLSAQLVKVLDDPNTCWQFQSEIISGAQAREIISRSLADRNLAASATYDGSGIRLSYYAVVYGRRTEGYFYKSRCPETAQRPYQFFVGAEGMANYNSLVILEKEADTGAPKNGFGESSRAGGGGVIVGFNTDILSRAFLLPNSSSPRWPAATAAPFTTVERVVFSFDFFDQKTNHVFPANPQTFIGATSKYMITGEMQFGLNVAPGVQIYGIGGVTFLNQDLNINLGGLGTSENKTSVGPTYGAGLGYQIPGSAVTSFVQWEQTPFATKTLTRPPASPNFTYDFTNTSNRIKAGILVNFGQF